MTGTCCSIDSIFSCEYKSLTPKLRRDWITREIRVKEDVLGKFFDDTGEIWNICSKEFFLNTHNLDLLGLMLDATAWTRLFPSRAHMRVELETVIGPVLRWFNRQLVGILTYLLRVETK